MFHSFIGALGENKKKSVNFKHTALIKFATPDLYYIHIGKIYILIRASV